MVECKPLLSSQSLRDSLEFLRMKRLRAAPVWDPKKNDFLGSCDMRTLLGTLLFRKEDYKASLVPEKPNTERGSSDFKELVASKVAGPAGDIALNNEFRIIGPDANLSEPLAVFGRGSCMIVGVRGAYEKDPSAINLITQGRFLQYLFDIPRFRKFLDGFTNRSLAVAHTSVIRLCKTEPIRDGIRTLAKWYVSCVAIVDESGKLVDNLSITDSYNLFTGTSTSADDETIEMYIRRVRGTKFIEDLVFPNGTSIRKIVEVMLKQKILHAWIVNNNHEPLQCISATDIFKLVYMEYRKMYRTQQMGIDDDDDLIPSSFFNLLAKLNFTSILRIGFVLYCFWKIRNFLRRAFP